MSYLVGYSTGLSSALEIDSRVLLSTAGDCPKPEGLFFTTGTIAIFDHFLIRIFV